MMQRIVGLFAVVPATLLLTVSFFVLMAIRKIENQGLKAFGYVVASLLWLSALVAFSAGLYTLSTGRCPMMDAMKSKCMMMRGGPSMPVMADQSGGPMMKH